MPKNFVSNKDESVRMFKSNFLEMLSKVHFTVPLFIFIPYIGYQIFISFTERSFSFGQALGLIIGGFVTWTATEYLLHRFVFHYEPSSKFGKKVHFIMHGVHHDYPNDSRRLVMPPILSIPLATLFFFLFKITVGEYGLPLFFGSFLTGYLIYDIGHYAIHHFKMKGKLLTAIKNHHMRHHYVDPENGYGVSSPIWDFVFRTEYKKEEEIEKSRDIGKSSMVTLEGRIAPKKSQS